MHVEFKHAHNMVTLPYIFQASIFQPLKYMCPLKTKNQIRHVYPRVGLDYGEEVHRLSRIST